MYGKHSCNKINVDQHIPAATRGSTHSLSLNNKLNLHNKKTIWPVTLTWFTKVIRINLKLNIPKTYLKVI